MWLVLCEDGDEAAQWACRRLQARCALPVMTVSGQALALGECLGHTVGADPPSVRLVTDGGVHIDGADLRGVLNRLHVLPVDHWRRAAPAEQSYVQQELMALTLSWLHGLACPVVNRATPQGLCGRWRHDAEWLWMAAQVGLPAVPYQLSSRLADAQYQEEIRPPSGAAVASVIVIGDLVLGAPVPDDVATACRRLARRAGTELLGMYFHAGAGDAWTFAGASPVPDLRRGGEALIDALAHRLGMVGERA